nr:GUN4 domain-containing protein [Spirulina subsalsa]
MQKIDRLWVQHSNRRFGFSVQKRISLAKMENTITTPPPYPTPSPSKRRLTP